MSGRTKFNLQVEGKLYEAWYEIVQGNRVLHYMLQGPGNRADHRGFESLDMIAPAATNLPASSPSPKAAEKGDMLEMAEQTPPLCRPASGSSGPLAKTGLPNGEEQLGIAPAGSSLVGGVPPKRILFDIRETELLRGYHAIAAATVISERSPMAQYFFLSTGHPDEQLAAQVFRFDTGVVAKDWLPHYGNELFFDVYVCVADAWPGDIVTRGAVDRSKTFIFCSTFADHGEYAPNVILANGHDIIEIAEAAINCVR